MWVRIRGDCKNPNSNRFKYLGARGIVVCPEWNEDFMNFYKWALDNGYQDKLYLQRKDINGNFEPSNCYFSKTRKQNGSMLIPYNGETHTASEWAELLGVSGDVIGSRIRMGWTAEECLFGRRKLRKMRKGGGHCVKD
jgi:hypothetical protein